MGKQTLEIKVGVTYRYYENRVWNKARVHVSDCSFCNDGQGIHVDASQENGWWSEPYDTLEEALVAAGETGKVVSECKRCLKMDMRLLEDLFLAV